MNTSDIIAIVGTFVNTAMFIATACMAYYTKKSLDTQNQPQIMVSLTPVAEEPLMLGILVENVGTGPAYDISFSGHEGLGIETGFMKYGIKYLAQKSSRIFWWEQFYFLNKDNLHTHITIHYYTSSKSKLSTTCILDI